MMIFTPHAGLIEALKGGKIYYASLALAAAIRLQIYVNLSFPIDSSEKTQTAAGLCHGVLVRHFPTLLKSRGAEFPSERESILMRRHGETFV